MLLGLCLAAIGCRDQASGNGKGPPNPRGVCRATADLRDGSRVVGELVEETIPFQSDLLGDFWLPVNKLRALQWPREDQPTARLQAVNGDELQVRLRAPALRLKTQFGEVKLTTALLKQVQFMGISVPAELSRGLIALWSAENNARDSKGEHDGEMRFGASFAPGKVGRAFHFTTNRGRVHIEDSPDFAFNGSFTIAGWVYVDEFPEPGGGGLICIRGDNRPGLDTWTISTAPEDHIAFGIGGEDSDGTGVSAPAKRGQWIYVAGTYDETLGQVALYLDGQLAAETNNAVKPIWQLDSGTEPGVGLGNTAGTFHVFPFRGRLDELALYARALSEAEIQALVDLGNGGERLLPVK